MRQPAKKPEKTRGMPRSLFYAMIPLGFILLILILITLGTWTRETTDQPADVVDAPLNPEDEPTTQPAN